MARIPGIRRLFQLPTSEERVTNEVEDEIAFHVEERTQTLIAQGMDPAAARAAALREFGDVREARVELEAIARRRVQQTRRSDWWSDLRQDLRYGARALRRAPLFSLLAILTLALVLRQGAGWMAAGLAGGALGIVTVVQLLRDLLYEVAPFDPIALGVAIGMLLACATLALLAPVRRALRVDPAAALRAQ
ncbi:MAG: hypothetical protein GEV06_26755 [Luteitalea sp.]|nr:hypothetical protein [Luteitalea sp.]